MTSTTSGSVTVVLSNFASPSARAYDQAAQDATEAGFVLLTGVQYAEVTQPDGFRVVEVTFAAEYPDPDLGPSTIQTSLAELKKADADLEAVQMALVNTNAYADGPRRDLDVAFATIQVAIQAQRDEWEQASREVAEDTLTGMIDRELDRISGGRGCDADGVPYHPKGYERANEPTHQVTALKDSENFALIACWSDFHATLEYARAIIQYPDYSVSLSVWDRSEDTFGMREQRHTYRTAAGDAADGECDCGKGDYCPQYGRLAQPLPTEGQIVSVYFDDGTTAAWVDAEFQGIDPRTGDWLLREDGREDAATFGRDQIVNWKVQKSPVTILEGPDRLDAYWVATVRVDGAWKATVVQRRVDGTVWVEADGGAQILPRPHGRKVVDDLESLIFASHRDDVADGGEPTPEDKAMTAQAQRGTWR